MQSIAVVPAAGASRRMGAPKLLLPWRGKKIIEHVLDAWRRSAVTHVVVVVRADDAMLIDMVTPYDVTLVRAAPPPAEMKDSVALGLERARACHAPQPSDAWLLAPADMPRLSPQVIDTLLAAHDVHSPEILIPRVGRKNGHPVLFPWSLAEEVRRLSASEGVKALRERFPHRAIQVDEDAGFDDLDTPEDYAKLRD